MVKEPIANKIKDGNLLKNCWKISLDIWNILKMFINKILSLNQIQIDKNIISIDREIIVE